MKYRNKPVTIDGVRFDSRREAKRWGELQILQRAGRIAALERQCVYVLAPAVRIQGEKRARPPLRYVADFVYNETGGPVVEDVKGVATPAWRIKQHLMKALLGIDVRVIR